MLKNKIRQSCGVSLISNFEEESKPFEKYFEDYKSRLVDLIEPSDRLHIHLSNYEISAFKSEYNGINHYFIYQKDEAAFKTIIKIENISIDDVYMYLVAWPGRMDPELEHWQVSLKKIVYFGDLHHLTNPLKYAYEFLSKFKPARVFFWSSIQNADFICVYLGIEYSLQNYSLKTKPAERIYSPKFNIAYFGSVSSKFHPLRTLTNSVFANEEIILYRRQSLKKWFESISNSHIYLHTTLAGNFSQHILFPLKKGAVLLIEESVAQNFYMSFFLKPDYTCITYKPGEALSDLTSRYSKNELNEIALNGQNQINFYFKDYVLGAYYETQNYLETQNQLAIIKPKVKILKNLIEGISENQLQTIICLMEILQEIHRFFIKPVQIVIPKEWDLCKLMLHLIESFYYFEISERESACIPCIVLNLNESSEKYKEGMEITIGKYEKTIIKTTKSFNFINFFEIFKDHIYWSNESQTWPQLLLENISVNSISQKC
jgi:hypothetical protein